MLKKYKNNLRIENNFVISYATKVAVIEGDYLRKLDWKIKRKNKYGCTEEITTSPTTTRHINYVAEVYDYKII